MLILYFENSPFGVIMSWTGQVGKFGSGQVTENELVNISGVLRAQFSHKMHQWRVSVSD